MGDDRRKPVLRTKGSLPSILGWPRGLLISLAITVAVTIGFVGFLIGRWSLPNNGPCTVDYGVLAAWVAAIAAAALVIVGIIAARYAFQTAQSAVETVKVESEAMILVEVDNLGDDEPRFTFAVRSYDEGLMPGIAVENSKGRQLKVRVRNVGRRPAYNVKVAIVVEDLLDRLSPMRQVFFIQGLLPNESAVALIQNDVNTSLRIGIGGLTIGSVAQPGADIEAPLFVSSAFPMPLG